jgi:two-component sensor histidine kinase
MDLEMLHAPESERKRLLLCLARTRSLALAHDLTDHTIERVDVGMLTHAVMDTVRALFPGIAGAVEIRDVSSISISAKRATYLGLALTEITVQMLYGALKQESRTWPTIVLTQEDDLLCFTLEHPSCSTASCDLEFGSLSRDILHGMVERALQGSLELTNDLTFRAIIRCPLDTPGKE